MSKLCVTAPLLTDGTCRYLNQCWFPISGFCVIHLRAISQWVPKLLFCIMSLKLYFFIYIITSTSPRGRWVKQSLFPSESQPFYFPCYWHPSRHPGSSQRVFDCRTKRYPDSKVHGANMGPTWGRQDPGGPHVGPRTLLSGYSFITSCTDMERLSCWRFLSSLAAQEVVVTTTSGAAKPLVQLMIKNSNMTTFPFHFVLVFIDKYRYTEISECINLLTYVQRQKIHRSCIDLVGDIVVKTCIKNLYA